MDYRSVLKILRSKEHLISLTNSSKTSKGIPEALQHANKHDVVKHAAKKCTSMVTEWTFYEILECELLGRNLEQSYVQPMSNTANAFDMQEP